MIPLHQRPVAVLGADSPIGLTVVRELGEAGLRVIVLGKTDHALARHSRHAAGFARIGAPLEQWLPRFVAENGVGSVLAISEHHLIALAQMPPLPGGCRVIAPDAARLELVLDKARTLEIAAGLGLDVPQSWQPVAGEDHALRAAALAFPVAVKWPDPNAVSARLGAAGLALEKVEYADGAAALLAILARYDALGAWPLVQTWCPGEGLGQMLHVHKGRATLRFQHRRLRECPPSGGVSTLCAAIPLDQYADQMVRSEALLAAIGWEGPAMVEYRHDPATGRFWLMEINGRFWGSLPLAYHCGVHFAAETWRCAMLGEGAAYAEHETPDTPTPPVLSLSKPVLSGCCKQTAEGDRPFLPDVSQGGKNKGSASTSSARTGVGAGAEVALRPPVGHIPHLRARYLIPDARALALTLADGKRGLAGRALAVVRFLADFLDPRARWYVWSWRDPGPFFGDMAAVIRKILRRGKPAAD